MITKYQTTVAKLLWRQNGSSNALQAIVVADVRAWAAIAVYHTAFSVVYYQLAICKRGCGIEAARAAEKSAVALSVTLTAGSVAFAACDVSNHLMAVTCPFM
jgi:hypothetical protein